MEVEADQTTVTSLKPGGGGGVCGATRFFTPRLDSSSTDSIPLLPHDSPPLALKISKNPEEILETKQQIEEELGCENQNWSHEDSKAGPAPALVKAKLPWSARRGDIEKERVLKTVKGRSTLPETPPPKKTSVATPSRISKLSRGLPKTEGDPTSSMNNSSRLSLDRSASRSANSKTSLDKDTPPKSVAAKTLVDRRSPRLTTPPEKIHAAKESENQAKLNDLQEDLKKAKEQLALLENEKAAAVSEFKEAKRIADAANEKLSEALVAQKRAEEDSEIEKFRALEIEQVTQKKEEEWMKEIETIRSQHAIDVEALLSTTLKLQRLKEELSMTLDAKNQALCHADDANKIAEVHAEKAEMLSVEVNKLKALLDSKVESEAYVDMMVTELKSEVAFLKQALEKTIILKEKIAEQDETLKQITSGSSAFPFNTGTANNTPAAQPLFGNSNSVQVTSLASPIFGQPSANASSFGFMGPTPSGSSNSFQLGSQQNLSNPSLFQASRSLGGFSASGSYSLGTPTGGDKSSRRIIMAKQGRRK